MTDTTRKLAFASSEMVYPAEMRKRAEGVQARGAGEGKSTPPAYLVELHNLLAVLTQ